MATRRREMLRNRWLVEKPDTAREICAALGSFAFAQDDTTYKQHSAACPPTKAPELEQRQLWATRPLR